jgi:hypothetical protein
MEVNGAKYTIYSFPDVLLGDGPPLLSFYIGAV